MASKFAVNPFCDIELCEGGASKILTATTSPRYYLDHDTRSTWHDIDTTPRGGNSQYYFAVEDTFARLLFAPRASGDAMVRIYSPYCSSTAHYTLRVSRLGDAVCSPQVVDAQGNSVYFLLDDTAFLEFDISGRRINKKIVISRRPQWNSVTIELSRYGGALAVQSDGAVLGTREGRAVLRFAQPSAWQAGVGWDGIPLAVTPRTTITYPRAGVVELTIHLDDAWLDSAIYPITVDPTITLQPYPDTAGVDCRLVAGGGYDNTNFNDALLSLVNAIGGLTACSLVQFDLSALPSGAVIDSATLSLYRSAVGASSGIGVNVVTAQLLRRAWIETQASWNSAKTGTAWGTAGAQSTASDILATPSASATVDISGSNARTDWSVAALVQEIANGMSNNGFRLSQPASAGSYAHMHSSSGAGSADYAPRLVVVYHEGGTKRQAYLAPFGGSNILRGIG